MSHPPLQDICVIDMCHAWAGPHGTRLLADFGALVINVEYSRRLGLFRGGRTADQAYNKQPAWFHVNRNKFSITLDLKEDKHHGIFQDLVRDADVVVENGRTGVMGRMGFSYEELVQLKPDLIMLSMPAYGSTGPDATSPSYGGVIEAMSGIQNLTGYGAHEPPQRIRELDVINGLGAACAVMTALLHRQRTGEGQQIDLSQMEISTHALIGEHLLEHVMDGTHAPILGNRHRCFAPQGCYRCKGDDKWITLTIRSDADWSRFCEALGREQWTEDPRFVTATARMENHDELDRLIENWTGQRSHYEAMRLLQDHAIPSGAVLTTAELAADPHLLERGYFVHGVSGSNRPFMGPPFRMSQGNGSVRWRGPDLGEHNEHVICERLGRAKDDVPVLREDEIGTAYDPE